MFRCHDDLRKHAIGAWAREKAKELLRESSGQKSWTHFHKHIRTCGQGNPHFEDMGEDLSNPAEKSVKS